MVVTTEMFLVIMLESTTCCLDPDYVDLLGTKEPRILDPVCTYES